MELAESRLSRLRCPAFGGATYGLRIYKLFDWNDRCYTGVIALRAGHIFSRWRCETNPLICWYRMLICYATRFVRCGRNGLSPLMLLSYCPDICILFGFYRKNIQPSRANGFARTRYFQHLKISSGYPRYTRFFDAHWLTVTRSRSIIPLKRSIKPIVFSNFLYATDIVENSFPEWGL